MSKFSLIEMKFHLNRFVGLLVVSRVNDTFDMIQELYAPCTLNRIQEWIMAEISSGLKTMSNEALISGVRALSVTTSLLHVTKR